MKLHDRIAIVTGAGRGIGRGCALTLAERGADLFLNDRPGSPDLQATAEEVRALGRKCAIIEADAFSRKGCEQIVTAALENFPRIDILLSVPATSVRSPFLELDPAGFNATVNGTLTAGFHISQMVARHMVERGGGGKIVFISSVQAVRPIAQSVAYGAAKAGLNHMMRTIAVELAPHRINVNAIEPGWIDTPAEHECFGSEFLAERGRALPLGRLGRPDEIGKAAAYLVSSDAEYVTGAILRVEGCFVYKDCGDESAASPRDGS